ncbi:endopeptidase catalytic subunit [Saccharomycopsis crataegensis]|uniref:Mitochondrial inner membrane protease subunit n=1 Tax=Saccharomycopsis crataegensis TaxID=43959 RepID=A0AAV5QMA9_9ASCO|nr:endopeptidase catalytic subunit [Saccharomycopsis crataegensis]
MRTQSTIFTRYFTAVAKASPIVFNVLLAAHIASSYSYEYIASYGDSMLPTLHSFSDYLVISRAYRRGKGITTGDMVSCCKPTEPMSRVCKRVTGMPGDIILVDPSKSSIYTNFSEYIKDYAVSNKENLGVKDIRDATTDETSQWVDELETTLDKNKTYQEQSSTTHNQFIRIPEGHCWLTGDNLNNSLDSRVYNMVPLALINGKVEYAVYVSSPWKWWTWDIRKIENIYKDKEQ